MNAASPTKNAPSPPPARKDPLRQLRAFCQTARLGSITGAADYLFSSQPAVSQQIRSLESEIGVALFERSGPRITLTDAGEKLYRLAAPAMMDIDRLPETFAERHHGLVSRDLTLVAGKGSAAFLVGNCLKRFRTEHPEIRVNVKTGTGSERLRWLRAYEVDLAFGSLDVVPPDLTYRTFLRSRIFLITPENHPLAGRDSVELHEIAAHSLVGHTRESFIRRFFDTLVRQSGASFDIVVEVDGWNVIKRYVEAGVGVSIVPDICLTARDRVWPIPLDEFFPVRSYGVALRRDDTPSLATERFMEVLGLNVAEDS